MRTPGLSLRYAASVFLGAFLLFEIQPLIARYILPWFGGTPAVWTTCMLFFQVLLLAGYAYAHWLISRLGPRAQATTHSVVVAASAAALVAMAVGWGTPLVPTAGWKPHDSSYPIPRILAILTVAVGLPYFVLASTSPLLQAWFHRTEGGRSPYRLYTLSNIGSLLALVSYPVVVEPLLALRSQALAWSGGFALFALGVVRCALAVWRQRAGEAMEAAPSEPEADAAPPTRARRLLWVLLPAVASTLLLATTNRICLDVAVIPFLWVLPLSLYLLSFILCFDSERWYSRRYYALALLLSLGGIAAAMIRPHAVGVLIQILAYSIAMFVCCMVCHGELVAMKPHSRHLTSFYLAISVGGALGGLFVGLAAPFLFRGFGELQVGLVLSGVLGVALTLRETRLRTVARVPLAVLLAAVTALIPAAPWLGTLGSERAAVASWRNFYGLLRVEVMDADVPDRACRVLLHGQTLHGWQFLSPARRREPTTYYCPDSGVGVAILHHPRYLAGDELRVGVVGLGTGAIAAYGRPGDRYRFYEINPVVLELSTSGGYFHYLSDCPAETDVVLGDARLSLEREREEGPQRFDVLALDAFSGDSVPVHLLTREALDICLGSMRDQDGIIAVHVTNRALDLKPVVYRLAEDAGLAVGLIEDPGAGEGALSSDWMLLTRNPRILEAPGIAEALDARPDGASVGLWTDDYHSLFPILRWKR